MIDKIKLLRFKGFERSVDVGPLTLLVGPNGTGKSSIMEAAQLALTGKITGHAEVDGTMWREFATGDVMMTGVYGSGFTVERSLTRVGDKTRHSGAVNGTPRKKAEMDVAIESATGGVAVVSMQRFWGFSEAQQVRGLAKYYQGAVSIAGINAQFAEGVRLKELPTSYPEFFDALAEAIKEQKSGLTTKAKGADLAIESLGKQKVSIERPAGTLAEVQKELTSLKQTASMIRVDPEAYKRNVAAWDAWQKEKNAVMAHLALYSSQSLLGLDEYQTQRDELVGKLARIAAPLETPCPGGTREHAESLGRIRAGMISAGCDACPVLLLVKKEQRALIPGQPAAPADASESKVTVEIQLRVVDEKIKKRQSMDQAQANLDRILADPRGTRPKQDPEKEKAAAGIAARQAVLEGHEKLFQRLADLTASIERTRSDKVTAEASLTTVKEAEKKLQGIRKQILGEIFTPIIEAVNDYLPSGVCHVGFDTSDHLVIGWTIDDVFRQRDVLSGGEKALFDPAFALGLMALEPINTGLRLLLIEAAEVDDRNITVFLDRLSMFRGERVQIIVSTWVQVSALQQEWNAEAWKIVRLAAPIATSAAAEEEEVRDAA